MPVGVLSLTYSECVDGDDSISSLASAGGASTSTMSSFDHVRGDVGRATAVTTGTCVLTTTAGGGAMGRGGSCGRESSLAGGEVDKRSLFTGLVFVASLFPALLATAAALLAAEAALLALAAEAAAGGGAAPSRGTKRRCSRVSVEGMCVEGCAPGQEILDCCTAY